MKSLAWPVFLAILNTVAFVAMVAVNGMANSLPINGLSTGELSDSYPNLFVPAGFTFAIWGVIYSLLLAFTVYQLVATLGGSGKAVRLVTAVGLWFAVSSLANIAWIFAWHYERVFLSVVCMVVLLTALIATYLRLQIGTTPSSPYTPRFIEIAFGVYLGWITVATVANVTALLVDVNWDGFGIPEPIWTAIMIVVASAIGIAMLSSRGDAVFVLVILWALLGIFTKRMATDPREPVVISAAVVCGAVLVGGIVYRLFSSKAF